MISGNNELAIDESEESRECGSRRSSLNAVVIWMDC